MQVWLVTQTNEMYNSIENIFVFGSKQRALDYLMSIRDAAEDNGTLEDSNLTWAAPYVTAIDTDNMMYTVQLDPVPKSIL